MNSTPNAGMDEIDFVLKKLKAETREVFNFSWFQLLHSEAKINHDAYFVKVNNGGSLS